MSPVGVNLIFFKRLPVELGVGAPDSPPCIIVFVDADLQGVLKDRVDPLRAPLPQLLRQFLGSLANLRKELLLPT